MADEKYGIEKLKEIAQFIVDIQKVLKADLSDNKLSFGEMLGLFPRLTVIQDWVANKEEILNQAKDVSLDEVKELVAVIEGGLDNQKLVAVIEHGLNTAVSGIALIGAIKDLTAKPVTETPATDTTQPPVQ